MLTLYSDNMISSIKIKGFRGFAEEQELKLSKPNGEEGSGLTVIVGPNNGGKSTIIESFKVMSSGNHISFAEGQRNKAAGDAVEIVLSFDDGSIHNLETILAGGHKAKRNPWLEGKITILIIHRLLSCHLGDFLTHIQKKRHVETVVYLQHDLTISRLELEGSQLMLMITNCSKL